MSQQTKQATSLYWWLKSSDRNKALKTVKSHGQLTRSIALFSLIISQIYVSNSLCSLSNKAKNSLCPPHSRYICWERLLLLIPWDYSAMFTHWVGTQTENPNFHLCTSMRCKPNISESLRKSSQIFHQLPFPNLKTLPLLINLFLFSLLSVASAFNQMFQWTSFFTSHYVLLCPQIPSLCLERTLMLVYLFCYLHYLSFRMFLNSSNIFSFWFYHFFAYYLIFWSMLIQTNKPTKISNLKELKYKSSSHEKLFPISIIWSMILFICSWILQDKGIRYFIDIHGTRDREWSHKYGGTEKEILWREKMKMWRNYFNTA